MQMVEEQTEAVLTLDSTEIESVLSGLEALQMDVLQGESFRELAETSSAIDVDDVIERAKLADELYERIEAEAAKQLE